MQDLAEKIAAEFDMTKTLSEELVNSVFDSIKEEVRRPGHHRWRCRIGHAFFLSQVARGNEVSIAGFGKFEMRERAARAGRNPKVRQGLLGLDDTMPAAAWCLKSGDGSLGRSNT